MEQRLGKKSKLSGLPPGTLVYTGKRKQEPVALTVFEYGEGIPTLRRDTQVVSDCFPLNRQPGVVTWLNVDGIHQISILEEIGEKVGIHPLLLEDILHTAQRPKMDQFEDYTFIELNMLYWSEQEFILESEQVSLLLSDHFVITFQEQGRDVFDAVRKRLQEGRGKIIHAGADYLTYTLIDAIVDQYFVILEKLGDQIEDLEDALILNPHRDVLISIQQLRREIAFLRKSVWPLREVLGTLERGESPQFSSPTLIYLRDVYEHTIQIIDTIETFRDLISGMLDIYLSSVSNRMNEVMKVLTMIATIFMPLSFVVGIYGMNFKFMPEINWRWGYFAVWIVLIGISSTMLIYFRKKNWF